MFKKNGKDKPKRFSRGKRIHVRRMKQEARSLGLIYKPVTQ